MFQPLTGQEMIMPSKQSKTKEWLWSVSYFNKYTKLVKKWRLGFLTAYIVRLKVL